MVQRSIKLNETQLRALIRQCITEAPKKSLTKPALSVKKPEGKFDQKAWLKWLDEWEVARDAEGVELDYDLVSGQGDANSIIDKFKLSCFKKGMTPDEAVAKAVMTL